MESSDRRNREARERLEREIRERRERDERLDRDRQKNPDSISNSRNSFSVNERENMSKSELDQIRNQAQRDFHSGAPTSARGYGSQHPERMGSSNESTINNSQSSRMTMDNNSSNLSGEGQRSSSIKESRNPSDSNPDDSWSVERYDTGWGVSNKSESSGTDISTNRSIPTDQGGYEDRPRNSFERPSGEGVWNRRESEFGRREDTSSRYPENRNNAGESYNPERDNSDRERRESPGEEKRNNDDLRKLRNSRAEREDRDREW